MHLLWHIFKKDFRHLRGLVAAYWAVLAAYLVLPWWIFSRPEHPLLVEMRDLSQTVFSGTFSYLGWTENFLFAVGALLIAVIGALLVLADSPNVENALYRTLPVTRLKLLTAKVVFLLLVITLPYCGGGVLTKILQGDPIGEWLEGSGTAVMISLFAAVPAVLAAVQFESLVLRVLFFLGIIGLSLFACASGEFPKGNPDQVIIACMGIFFGLGTGLIVLQYRGRGKVACTGLLLAALLGLWLWLPDLLTAMVSETSMARDISGFPLNFATYNYTLYRQPPPVEIILPALNFQSAGNTSFKTQSFAGSESSPKIHTRNIFTYLGRLSNWPENPPQGEVALLDFWELHPSDLPENVRVSDTSDDINIYSKLLNLSSWGMPINLPSLAAAAGLGQMRLAEVDDSKPDAWPLLQLQEMDDLRLKLPTQVTGTLHYQTGTILRVAEAPLKIGAELTVGTSVTRLLRVNFQSAQTQNYRYGRALEYPLVQLFLGCEWTQPAPWPAFINLPPMRATTPREFYFLWNPKAKNCFPIELPTPLMMGERFTWSNFTKIQCFNTAYSLRLNGTQVDFRYFENGQARVMTDDEAKAWLADAKIVVVEFTPKHFYQAQATFGPLEHPPVAAMP